MTVGVASAEYHHAGAVPNAFCLTGASPAVAAGRVAYSLGLSAPAVAVDTACSASMVAVHVAAGTLDQHTDGCQEAMAGGAHLALRCEGVGTARYML